MGEGIGPDCASEWESVRVALRTLWWLIEAINLFSELHKNKTQHPIVIPMKKENDTFGM